MRLGAGTREIPENTNQVLVSLSRLSHPFPPNRERVGLIENQGPVSFSPFPTLPQPFPGRGFSPFPTPRKGGRERSGGAKTSPQPEEPTTHPTRKVKPARSRPVKLTP